MKVHTYAEALEDLKALVQERGEDYRYRMRGNRCTYERDGQPDCGLGKVFHDRWGVDIQILSDLDACQWAVDGVLRDQGHQYTEKAQALLFHFQDRQDDADRYGDCLSSAIQHATTGGPFDDTAPANEEV